MPKNERSDVQSTVDEIKEKLVVMANGCYDGERVKQFRDLAKSRNTYQCRLNLN